MYKLNDHYFFAGSLSKAAIQTMVGWENLTHSEKQEHEQLFRKEIRIHSSLQHKNVVRLLGICMRPALSSFQEFAQVNLADFAHFADGDSHCVYNLRQLLMSMVRPLTFWRSSISTHRLRSTLPMG